MKEKIIEILKKYQEPQGNGYDAEITLPFLPCYNYYNAAEQIEQLLTTEAKTRNEPPPKLGAEEFCKCTEPPEREDETITFCGKCGKIVEELSDMKLIEQYASQQGDGWVSKAEFDEAVKLLQYFVDRVEAGTIRSKTTYAKYKEFLDMYSQPPNNQ